MKICVTGGLGFIGGELIKALVDCGVSTRSEIINIDDADKRYLGEESEIQFYDYNGIMKDYDFSILNDVDFIFHLGANSSTRAAYMDLYYTNYDFSVRLILWALEHNKPIVVASSASVYGARRDGNKISTQTPYAYLKAIVDLTIQEHFQSLSPLGKVVSLRFHNVYGANETHKGGMASIICKWIDNHLNGIKTNDLFNDSENIIRDFVYVDDVVNSLYVMLDYYIREKELPHYYTLDIGTGKGVSFEAVAKEIVKHTKGTIQYVINPYTEKDYQFYTQADMTDFKKIYKSLYECDFVPTDIYSGIEKVYNEKKHLHDNRVINSDITSVAGM